MRTGTHSSRSRQGFTLAELIVATTMIAIVMSAVYTAFHSAIRAWRAGEANYQTYQDARIALGLLAQELRSMPIGSFEWMVGADDEIEFYTLSPPMNVEDGEGPAALKVKYTLSRADARSAHTLVREEQIVEGPIPVAPACDGSVRTGKVKLGRTHKFELAHGVQDFSIAYFWRPPPPRRDNHIPPQYPVTMIEEPLNKECWGAPAAIVLSLTLDDPGAADRNNRTTIEHSVTFRFNTTGLPEELREKFAGRAR
jgi:prepilin-type N-terminal cleavage/methylation domain-containing protein